YFFALAGFDFFSLQPPSQSINFNAYLVIGSMPSILPKMHQPGVYYLLGLTNFLMRLSASSRLSPPFASAVAFPPPFASPGPLCLLVLFFCLLVLLVVFVLPPPCRRFSSRLASYPALVEEF
ncbi:hypothetical protein NQ318_002923, partial [Aromia moschata]